MDKPLQIYARSTGNDACIPIRLRHRAFVGIEVEIFDESAIVQRPDAPGEALDEVAVVDDGEDCAVEVFQRHLELLARRDVEVVE